MIFSWIFTRSNEFNQISSGSRYIKLLITDPIFGSGFTTLKYQAAGTSLTLPPSSQCAGKSSWKYTGKYFSVSRRKSSIRASGPTVLLYTYIAQRINIIVVDRTLPPFRCFIEQIFIRKYDHWPVVL